MRAGQAAANLGQTALKRRRRRADPMRDYDALPPVLRHWIAHAAMPWSPRSCLRVWRAARAKGATEVEALDRLTRAEAALLARDNAAPG